MTQDFSFGEGTPVRKKQEETKKIVQYINVHDGEAIFKELQYKLQERVDSIGKSYTSTDQTLDDEPGILQCIYEKSGILLSEGDQIFLKNKIKEANIEEKIEINKLLQQMEEALMRGPQDHEVSIRRDSNVLLQTIDKTE